MRSKFSNKAAAEAFRKHVEKISSATNKAAELAAIEHGVRLVDKAASLAPTSADAGRSRNYPGYLRDSRYVEKPRKVAGGYSTRVGFRAPYANYVHDRAAKHTDGDWKFLERASATLNAKRFAAVVTSNLKEQYARLGKGGMRSVTGTLRTSARLR
jgi:uncharacterized protein (UPF0210 family)